MMTIESRTAITLNTYNLTIIERTLCEQALRESETIADAAKLLGITRHALKRRIIKHNIRWSRVVGSSGVRDAG